MNNNQLNRLLKLIRKTGDRLVVADENSDEIFVVMNLEDYEDLSSNKECEDYLEDDECSGCLEDGECHGCNSYNSYEKDLYNHDCHCQSDDNEPEEGYYDEVDEEEESLAEKINENIAIIREEKKAEEALLSDELLENEINLSDEKIAEETVEYIEADNNMLAKPEGFMKKKSIMPSLGDVLSDENYRLRKFDHTPRKTWFEEEDLSDVKEEEEEKFYLEPVE